MSDLPKKFVIDTNVPMTANLALAPDTIPQELTGCVFSCVAAVEHVVKRGGLVRMQEMKSLMNTGNTFR